jgi:hypothetical protein
MNKPILGWVVAACACAPLASLAANGSIANAMVRDAAARRIAQQERADRIACENARRDARAACSTGPRERVKKT